MKFLGLAFSITIVAFALVFDSIPCLAQNQSSGYFDFQLSDNMLKDGQEVKVKFVWDIKDFEMKNQKRLTVRPFITGGAVEIFSTELNRYIGMTDFNSTLPYLRQEMTVKFNGVQSSQNPLLLNFVIYDTLTGKNYPTPVKKIWGTAYYKKYTDLLNDNLIKGDVDDSVIQLKSEDVTGPDSNVNKSHDKSKDPLKLYLWYLSPAFFLYGLLKSPNGFG